MSGMSDNKFSIKMLPINKIAILILVLGLSLVCFDYFTAVRVASVSSTTDLDARGGTITIQYNKKVDQTIYISASPDLSFTSELSKNKRSEIITLQKPTPYKKEFLLRRNRYNYTSSISGLFAPLETIVFSTGIEKVSIGGLIPPENSSPSPESMENQLVMIFKGEVRGKQKTNINIPASELPFITMKPVVRGYYQWSDDSTLAFNFTEDKPQFDTEYTFTIDPKKLINPDYQTWVGESATASVMTSSNDVYVIDKSSGLEISWQTDVRIEFSGNMVGALDVLKPKSQELVPIDISPKVKGHWQWVNARTIEFVPDSNEGWPIRQTINIRVNQEINRDPDRTWRESPGFSSFSFYVRPRLQSITSYNLHGEEVALDSDLVVNFSRPMIDQSLLNQRIQVGKDADVPLLIEPVIDGYFVWTNPDRLKFHPKNLWSELKKYKIKLNPNFNPDPRYEWHGTSEFEFKTVENVVRSEYYFTPEIAISPSKFFSSKNSYVMTDDVLPETRLWILFDTELGLHLDDSTDMRQVVKINPPIDVDHKWLSNSLLEIKPKQHWQERKRYRIELGQGLLHHPEQNFLEEQKQLVFSTGSNRINYNLAGAEYSESGELYALDPAGGINISFNKNMSPGLKIGRTYLSADTDQKLSPVTLVPPMNVEYRWLSARELTVTPIGYWPPETNYSLTLSNHILPVSEARYGDDSAINIKTKKNIVSISKLSPQGRVGRRIIMDVIFSKNIKPNSVDMGQLDKSGLFKIEPEVIGEWKWLAPNAIQFVPDKPLQTSTSYLVTFDPNKIADKQFTWHQPKEEDNAGVLRYPVSSYHFSTSSLHVVSSSARFEFNEKDILKQKFYLDMKLSAAVKETDLKRHFTIWYEKNTDEGKVVNVPLLYSFQSIDKNEKGEMQEFSVVSDWIERPANDRRIYYQITRDLNPVVGNLPLATDYRSDFLQEKPKHINIHNVQWKWEDSRYKAFISLSAPVEPDRLKKFMSIGTDFGAVDYELSVATASAYQNRNKFVYELSGRFIPGRNYLLRIEEGLLAADGAFTPDEISYRSTAPNLRQKLAFAQKGNVLPRYDLNKVPILTTNHKSFHMNIEKIFPNNVNYFLNNNIDSRDLSKLAKVVHSKTYNVSQLTSDKVSNSEIITHVDLRNLLPKNVYGLYRISVKQDEYYSRPSNNQRRWFVSTDIGLVARRFGDNMVVWVNSLQTLGAKAGVKVEVIDQWNQVIGSGVSGQDGFAKIQFTKGATPTHITAKLNDDFSFLDFRKHRDPLAGYNISGIGSKQTTVRSYIYSDRGVYRPGDTVHLVVVTRGKDGALPSSGLPVSFQLKNPTGKEIVTEMYEVSQDGIYVYDFQVPAEAKTGKWNASILWKDKPVGAYTFQIEEFIPNKIKVELEKLGATVTAGGFLEFKVKAKNLFGPPASGRRVSGTVSLRPHSFKPSGFSEFSFGHDDNQFQRIDYDLTETRLDNEGNHIYKYEIPDSIDSPIGVSAHYSATVLDDGGRGVSSYGQANVSLYPQYVGARRLNRAVINFGDSVGFEVVNVDSKGNLIARTQQQINARIYRNKRVTHYRKNERGYYRYVTEMERVLVAELNDPRDTENKFYYQPQYSGQHILEVSDAIGGQVTRYKFGVTGPRDAIDRAEAADKVELRVLDKNLAIGDTVKIEVRAPFKGKLLLTGERDKILFTHAVTINSLREIISVPLRPEHFPNFYISATLIKPVTQGSRTDPVFANGLINVEVTDTSQTPEIELIAPRRASPNGKMKVAVKISELDSKILAPMQFTIAAVDVGILDLTKFQTPDMKGYFNQKRALEVYHYSLYPMLMPYEPDAKITISPSGAAKSRALIKKKRVNPKANQRVKSVALWSGVLQTDDKGHGEIIFDLPDFDGTLRLMAVAFGDKKFVSKDAEVLVRDRLVMRPHLPRFMATGDDFVIPVTLFNGTEKDDDIKVTLKTTDHVRVLGPNKKTVSLQAGKESALDFALQINNILGVDEIELVAEGAGEASRKSVKIPVRTPGTLLDESGSGQVDITTPATISLPGGFVEGTQQLAMRINNNRLIEFQNSLRYLLRYPHGCLEQTTSKAFPLLYYNDIAMSTDKMFSAERTPKYFVKEAIKKIERMQLENGAFSYWEGGSSVNDWSFIYASHFLVEAKNSGLKITDAVWNNMVYRLQEMTSNRFVSGSLYSSNYQVSHGLYALYVLALANENVLSKLNYILDTYIDELKPHDISRLAAAFSVSGQQSVAARVIRRIGSFSAYDNPYRSTGGSLSSSVRDQAIILDAVATINPKSEQVPVLIKRLADRMRNGRWGSTQENAFAFLAIGKSLSSDEITLVKATITLGDGSSVPFKRELMLNTPELLKGDVQIDVEGGGKLNFAWQATGIEKNPKTLQIDEGLEIRRRFLDKDGNVADLSQVKQGDLLVAEIKIQSLGSQLSNVVITDLLPTGLEIENARLATSASLPWAKSNVTADYVDIRDDRINIFMTVPTSERTYYYTTRAVSIGNFKIPGIYAEAMYDPDISSKSGYGQLKVSRKEGRSEFAVNLK